MNNIKTIASRTVLVTGANRGIGRALVEEALGRGAKRVYAGTRHPLVHPDERVTPLILDITDPEQIREAVAKVDSLDILINNAGLALGRAPFDESSEEDEATVFAVNVTGLVRMTRLCLPHFGDWGHIVNMGSVAGRAAYEGGATYVSSKFAERGFTYALREDLLGRPVRITTVDPGLVETEFSLVRFKGDEEKAAEIGRASCRERV